MAGLMACAADKGNASSRLLCDQAMNHHDGDTFTCVPPKGQGDRFVVRVARIDAPETGQAYWRVARVRLRQLAANGSSVDCYKQDRYQRRVCRVTSADGQDAALVMLTEGLAWYPLTYSHEDEPAKRHGYIEAEATARAARRGIWAEPNPMEPHECRRARERGERCR
jgi:endonuclease YncB( thermonuclease family)